MAVSKNLWLRGAKQKLGGAVLYQLKGQTIMRELAASVSNPQTEAQQEQRTKLANIVALYRANKAWMEKYAFEGRPQKWSVYNAFVSANLTANEVQLTKQESAEGWGIVAPYIFTQGSLPSVELTPEPTDLTIVRTNIALGSEIGAGDIGDFTVGQVSAAIIANNNMLREGMQISLICNYQSQSGGVMYVTTRAYEVILDTTDNRAWYDVAPTLFVGDAGYLSINGDNMPTGVLVCISDDTDGSVKVSTQTMHLVDTGTYDSMTTDAQKARARVSYGGGATQPFLSKGYQSDNTQGNEDVPVTSSILSVQLRANTNAVVAGGYIGSFESESGGVMTIAMNTLPGTPTSLSINGTDLTSNVTLTTSGTDVVATYAAAPMNPATIITSVAVGFSNGETYTITFSNINVDE